MEIADFGGRRPCTGRHTTFFDVVHDGLRDRVRVVTDVVFVMIAVLANMVGQDATTILQMDGVSPSTVGKNHCYKEDDDTQPHSGAF